MRSTADTATTGCRAGTAQICSSADPATTSSTAEPGPTTPVRKCPREPRSLAPPPLSDRARSGSDGTDTLTGVEFVVFSDGRYSVVELLSPPANRSPLAAGDSASTPRGLSVVVEVLANDTDADGDDLDVTSVDPPAHGTATAHADGSVTYVPAAGFDGDDSFAYTVSDGRGGTDTASVSMTVFPASGGDALMSRIAAAPEGSWIKVNLNRFEDVWTPLPQRARVDGVPLGEPRKIIAAWSSMTWDPNRHHLIIWGGGHANYAGNDVYRFDAADLRWHRASLPSAVRTAVRRSAILHRGRRAQCADLVAHLRQPGVSVAAGSVHHVWGRQLQRRTVLRAR